MLGPRCERTSVAKRTGVPLPVCVPKDQKDEPYAVVVAGLLQEKLEMYVDSSSFACLEQRRPLVCWAKMVPCPVT